MSAVTLYAYDSSDETKDTALESVTVFVFSEDGDSFITSGSTDSEGQVTFDIPDATYWVRFFKAGFAFDTGLSVVVTEDDEFEVGGENLDTQPPATLDHQCRASGYIIGAAGQFLPDVTFEFKLNERVRIGGGYATGNAKVLTASNSDGYVEVDLLRNAVYEVVVESYGADVFVITVPDESSTNLTELIWPYLARVDLSTDSVSIDEGDDEDVTVTAVLSSGLSTPYNGISSTVYPRSVVSASSSDTDVATVSWDEETLTITGVEAGTCDIEFSTQLSPAKRATDIDVTLDTISVTVS